MVVGKFVRKTLSHKRKAQDLNLMQTMPRKLKQTGDYRLGNYCLHKVKCWS